jgi:hypothetical protein
MIHFQIRREEDLENVIIPLFDYLPLKTRKLHNFLIFKHCFRIYKNNNKTIEEKIDEITEYKKNPPLPVDPIKSRLNKS